MEFQFSKRAQRIQEGIFSVLDHKKTELLAAGRRVYNFSVGTPDFSPQPHIMKAVAEAAMDPENYKYALTDREELLSAMQVFYRTRLAQRAKVSGAISSPSMRMRSVKRSR